MAYAGVSIIIINYNTFELTCNCIQSVIEKTQNCLYEIIVVDNASTEKDPAEILNRFPQIILVRSSINVGFAKGNNLGIDHANREFILLLNSDCILVNDAVSRSHHFLKDHSQAGVVACKLEFPDGRVQHNCQRFPSFKYKLFELFRLQKVMSESGKILFGSFFDYNSIAYPDWVWGTFFMFRKKELNVFPAKKLTDDLFMYGEDIQWCMDFRNAGLTVTFLPDAKVIHFVGMSKGNRNQLMESHLEIFMEKNFSWTYRFLTKLSNLLLTGIYGY